MTETLGRLTREHPNRSIVVRPEAPAGFQVRAHCWMPFGRRQQVCSEHIFLAAPDLTPLAPVLRGLLAPDVPVVIWARDAWSDAAALFPLADKVIADSERGGTLRDLAALAGPDRLVADLTWTRLTPWRETIARMFETRGCMMRLREVREVEVDWAGPRGEYMAAWIGGVAGPDRVVLREVRSEPSIRVRGDGIGMTLTGAQWEVEGMPGRVVLPERGEYELLQEELSVLEPDAVFEDTLKRAGSS